MDHKKSLSLAAALGFAASLALTPALAQDAEQLPEQGQQKDLGEIQFQEIDGDGDGRVTQEEFMAHGSEEVFTDADEDGDGVLSEDEFKSAQERKGQEQEQPQ